MTMLGALFRAWSSLIDNGAMTVAGLRWSVATSSPNTNPHPDTIKRSSRLRPCRALSYFLSRALLSSIDSIFISVPIAS